MWKCPVCEKWNSDDGELFCRSCGFDSSCDYAHYPTLAKLSGKPQAISALRKIQEDQQADFLHCSKCGGRTFLFNQKEGTLLCANCGAVGYNEAPSKVQGMLQPRQQTAWHRIGASENCIAYVHPDSTVRGVCKISYRYIYDCVKTWRDIVSVSCGLGHIVGLHRDGTAVAAGNNEQGQCNVEAWRDVVAIDAGYEKTIGLCKNGTVLIAGRLKERDERIVTVWKNITAVAAGSVGYYGICQDGSVVSTWHDESFYGRVNRWKNVASISANYVHVVGLHPDGTVVAERDNSYGECNVQDWRDIVAVSTGGRHAAGLHRDGTVVATGDNRKGQCNVGHWRDIVEVVAGYSCTIGLRRDGSLVTAGLSKEEDQAVRNLTV